MYIIVNTLEIDPDTQKLHESIHGKSLCVKIMLVVYYRFCGSRVETLEFLAGVPDVSMWVSRLKSRPDETPIIRTDAYHANWGKGANSGRMFFLGGVCHKLAAFTAAAVCKWQREGSKHTMQALVDKMGCFFAKARAGPFRNMRFPFHCITVVFDIAVLCPATIDPLVRATTA